MEKKIIGTYYTVISSGLVKSEYCDKKNKLTTIFLKQSVNTHGYSYVTLSINKKKIGKKIHRLVAEAFIPNPHNKPCVNHINGIKTDNRVENLEWCTYSENAIHAYSMGLKTSSGEKNNNAVLTKNQVLEIKELRGILKIKEISIKYSVSQSCIKHIFLGNTWKNI